MKPPVLHGVAVVGVRFRSPAEILHAACVTSGDGLILEREPTNPYDASAVKVLADTVHIGYIERGYAGVISMWMGRGVYFTTTVVRNYKKYIVVNIRPITPPKKKKKVAVADERQTTMKLPIAIEDSMHGVFEGDLQ